MAKDQECHELFNDTITMTDLHQTGDTGNHINHWVLMSETHNYGNCPATQGAASCPDRKVVIIIVHKITLRGYHCYYLGIIEILPGNLPVPSVEKR